MNDLTARREALTNLVLDIDATPTPLGRRFVLGRSTRPGYMYADTDVFALGAVPDNPDAIPPGLL